MDNQSEKLEPSLIQPEAPKPEPASTVQKKEFDPDETQKLPSEEEILSALRGFTTGRSTGEEFDPRPRTIQREPTWENRLSDIAMNTRLIPTMLLQFGAMHPQRVNGKWRWVLRPNADVSRDPHQIDGVENENFYIHKFKKLKEEGVKLIDMESIGGETPSVRPVGIRGIQLLDHTRIISAMAVKMPIVVNFSRAETFS